MEREMRGRGRGGKGRGRVGQKVGGTGGREELIKEESTYVHTYVRTYIKSNRTRLDMMCSFHILRIILHRNHIT